MSSAAPATPLFLRACARQAVERPPVWIMRQAGRYLPEYRAIRERHGFLEMCRTPELAALVSAQPIERFGFDAAIIFSDILIPPIAMGARIDFNPGPVIEERIEGAAAIERLSVDDAERALAFVPAAIRILDERLRGETPIIGFAGGPFTVAAYLIDGGGGAFERTKALLCREPALAHALLDKLARVTASYLAAQREAGARALMLFDSHASVLSPEDYETFAAAYAERIFAAVGAGAPRIYFAPGAALRFPRMAKLGVEVLGADYRVSLGEARRLAGSAVALQGNLDPSVLLGPRQLVEERTRAMLRENAGAPGYIANLGHGILKDTPTENVEAFVACIREEGGRRESEGASSSRSPILALSKTHPPTPGSGETRSQDPRDARRDAEAAAPASGSRARVTADVLARYDRPGPRYTSYPTAVEFHSGFTPERYLAKLDEAAAHPGEPLSLYLHIPFCEERCTFCGCNVIITQKAGVADRYLDGLIDEIRLVASRLGDRRRVMQYHWGGGTPTYLTSSQIERLHAAVASEFEIAPAAEVAIEIDPRVTTREQLDLLRRLGWNRVSLGVQDFTPAVQEAVNRNQTLEETREIFHACRDLGFESINVDLIYGLPLQTESSFARSVDEVTALGADRVACYSFAMVPWLKSNQRGIEEDQLPDRDTKFALFGIALERFLAAGYRQIGMDHFAKATDELSRAVDERRLRRNFMGYTVLPASDMIGLGVSAIGEVRGAFAQNTKKLSDYYAMISAGRPPIERGYELTGDDWLRRRVIHEIMCNFAVETVEIEREFGIRFHEFFARELEELREGPASSGFLEILPERLFVTEMGRLFVRNIAMAFDRHLREKRGERPVFSRTV